MPYIRREIRPGLDKNETTPNNSGELNYKISKLVDEYLSKMGLNYTRINDVLGALEGAKLEVYARIARPYEDKKIKANGDVYNVDNVI